MKKAKYLTILLICICIVLIFLVHFYPNIVLDDVLSDDVDFNLTYWYQDSQSILTVKVKKQNVYVYVLENKNGFYYSDTDLKNNPNQYKSLFYSQNYKYDIKYKEVFHITKDEREIIMKYKDNFVKNLNSGYVEHGFDEYKYLILFTDGVMYAEPINMTNNQILILYMLQYCENIPKQYYDKYNSLSIYWKYYTHNSNILEKYKDKLDSISKQLVHIDDLEITYQPEFDYLNTKTDFDAETIENIRFIMKNAGFRKIYVGSYIIDDEHKWKVLKYSNNFLSDDTEHNMWDEYCLCYLDAGLSNMELINADNNVPFIFWNIKENYFCS